MSPDPALQRVQFQFTFILPALILLLLVRLLLGRPAWTVALPAWPPRWRDYLVAIGIGWGVMLTLLLAILAFMPGFKLTFRGWDGMVSGGATLVLMVCIGFMIQTAFEELYFRGLLMQATRRLTSWLPVLLVVQAYVFASLHAGNLEGHAASYLAIVPTSSRRSTSVGWRGDRIAGHADGPALRQQRLECAVREHEGRRDRHCRPVHRAFDPTQWVHRLRHLPGAARLRCGRMADATTRARASRLGRRAQGAELILDLMRQGGESAPDLERASSDSVGLARANRPPRRLVQFMQG